MEKVIDKISSYNLFNYLFPGILFAVLLAQFTSYSVTQDNLIVGLFVYYAIGLAISRVGSLLVYPALKWVKFIRFARYPDYIRASKKDEKIEILSEVNNMYRTITALFVLLFTIKLYEVVSSSLPMHGGEEWIFITLLLLLSLFSYRKQTKMVFDRVTSAK